MQKREWIVLIVGVVVIGVALFFLFGKGSAIGRGEYLDCREDCAFDDVNCINRCSQELLAKALEEKNVNYCDATSGDFRERCLIDYWSSRALEDDNPSFCNELKEENKIKECIVSAVVKKAVNDKDASVCGGLIQIDENLQEYCRMEVLNEA